MKKSLFWNLKSYCLLRCKNRIARINTLELLGHGLDDVTRLVFISLYMFIIPRFLQGTYHSHVLGKKGDLSIF